jgi:hypothetical protein
MALDETSRNELMGRLDERCCREISAQLTHLQPTIGRAATARRR